MEANKEAQKVIESSQSGQVIKSLSDLRIDKLETKLSQIEKLNNDLIAANKELYAFVANNYSQEKPAEQMKASADMSSQNTLAGQVQQPSIGVVTPPTAPTDEPNPDNVMKLMGYNSPDGQ